jgi:uncharacterized protein with PIN domain
MIVVDTSVILAILQAEPEALAFAELLAQEDVITAELNALIRRLRPYRKYPAP